MARAIWSGAISFGLVNIPVKLYTAISRKTVRFHQINEQTNNRIRQLRVDAETGQEVPFEQIVKGYELKDGTYIVTPEELAALDPVKTHTIDIEEFVDLGSIDPLYYDHAYYLVPDEAARKAYTLLTTALENAQKVAIAKVIVRSKEQLVVLRPSNGVLVMSSLVFADEIIGVDQFEGTLDSKVEVSAKELKMAEQLIESLSADFEPERFSDEYRERVIKLIERKADGETISVSTEVREVRHTPDLMAALEASLKSARERRNSKTSSSKHGVRHHSLKETQ